jgi:hypothetical protein
MGAPEGNKNAVGNNGGRPTVYDDPAAMQTQIDIYFAEEGKKTMTGLALAMGFDSRQSLYDYRKKVEFTCIINKALLRIEHQYEENLHGNNVAGSIFVLKKDQTQTDFTSGGEQIQGFNYVKPKQPEPYETK